MFVRVFPLVGPHGIVLEHDVISSAVMPAFRIPGTNTTARDFIGLKKKANKMLCAVLFLAECIKASPHADVTGAAILVCSHGDQVELYFAVKTPKDKVVYGDMYGDRELTLGQLSEVICAYYAKRQKGDA